MADKNANAQASFAAGMDAALPSFFRGTTEEEARNRKKKEDDAAAAAAAQQSQQTSGQEPSAWETMKSMGNDMSWAAKDMTNSAWSAIQGGGKKKK